MKTITEFFDGIVNDFQTSPAVNYKRGDSTETWTYADLRDRSNRVAHTLSERGVTKGDRVIIWAPNGPWWCASYFGALRLGAVLVPLDLASNPDYVGRVVAQTEPKLALLSGETLASWQSAVPSVKIEDFEALPRADGDLPPVDVAPNDLAVVMFTSGTTGTPKGVMLTHWNIVFDAEAADKYVPPTPKFRIVSLLPLSHMLEQSVGLLMAMKRRASIFYIPNRLPSTIFSALKEHGATTMVLAPRALQLFMSAIEQEVKKQGKEKLWERMQAVGEHMPEAVRRMMFRSVHQRLGGMVEFLVSGGAPIDAGLVRKWELMGIPIVQGYGATECGPIISATTLDVRDGLTVGRPIPGVEVKIADDGEVLARGENVTPGYWLNPKATEDAFDDGWYRTGDLGTLDERGCLYLHGRKKDMIVLSSGQKVYPQDVEQELLAVPGVLDAVVLGMPGDGGQDVYAVLIPDPEKPLVLDDAIRAANQRLAPHQRIKSGSIWPDKDFPRTFTFKVKKHEVLARLLGAETPTPQPEPATV